MRSDTGLKTRPDEETGNILSQRSAASINASTRSQIRLTSLGRLSRNVVGGLSVCLTEKVVIHG